MTGIGRALALGVAALICLSSCSAAVDTPAPPPAGSSTAELRDTAVRVAEQAAIAMTSLDHRNPDAGYDRLLALLHGPARQEWERQRATRLAAITADAVTVERGAVTASGVAALDPAGPTATVLVTTTARVAGKQAPVAQERRYRLRMALTRVAGEWKVSELQLVP